MEVIFKNEVPNNDNQLIVEIQIKDPKSSNPFKVLETLFKS